VKQVFLSSVLAPQTTEAITPSIVGMEGSTGEHMVGGQLATPTTVEASI